MHICLLSELFYPYLVGGAERRYFEIGKRLARKHDVTVYALNLRNQPKHEYVNGMEIIRMGLAHPIGKRSLFPLITYKPFLKALNSKYDIIDANQGMSSFMGLFTPFTKRPVVATFHDIYWDQWRLFHPSFFWLGKPFEFLLSRMRYNKIISNSPGTKKKLEHVGFSSPIEVVVSGIDLEYIKTIKAKKKEKTVLYVGRLIKYKNVDLLIKAFAEVNKEMPNAKLNIIGSGPEEHNLKALVKKCNANVDFLGFVTERRKTELMKSSTVLINPSDVEGLGLILLECMACETPIIAKRLPTYFFCNKKNSVLITNIEKELAPAILKLLQSKGLRNRMIRNGVKTSDKFSWDETTRRVEKIYRELV